MPVSNIKEPISSTAQSQPTIGSEKAQPISVAQTKEPYQDSSRKQPMPVSNIKEPISSSVQAHQKNTSQKSDPLEMNQSNEQVPPKPQTQTTTSKISEDKEIMQDIESEITQQVYEQQQQNKNKNDHLKLKPTQDSSDPFKLISQDQFKDLNNNDPDIKFKQNDKPNNSVKISKTFQPPNIKATYVAKNSKSDPKFDRESTDDFNSFRDNFDLDLDNLNPNSDNKSQMSLRPTSKTIFNPAQLDKLYTMSFIKPLASADEPLPVVPRETKLNDIFSNSSQDSFQISSQPSKGYMKNEPLPQMSIKSVAGFMKKSNKIIENNRSENKNSEDTEKSNSFGFLKPSPNDD